MFNCFRSANRQIIPFPIYAGTVSAPGHLKALRQDNLSSFRENRQQSQNTEKNQIFRIVVW